MTDAPARRPGVGARLGALVRDLAADIGLGLAWAALITVAVLFSGVVLQFTYVDF